MISSLWPLAVKGKIKRVSNNFVPLGLRAGEGKKKNKSKKRKISLWVFD